MTIEQWIFFILFAIVINIVMQVLAWKIGYWLGSKQDKERKTDEEHQILKEEDA